MLTTEYLKQLESKFNEATALLKQLVSKQTWDKKSVILFDIDETLLSSLHFHESGVLSRETPLETVLSVHGLAQHRALTPALRFFNYAKRLNIPIILLTGRPGYQWLKAATVDNLQQVGYSGWQKVFFAPATTDLGKLKTFKAKVRERLGRLLGLKIMLNIGDQASDFRGGHFEHAIQLPNPLYTF